MKLISSLAAATLLLTTVAAIDANAAGIRVKCEKRATRSAISVDGRNLPVGNYSSHVISGDNQASAPLKASIGDEVEFDYDSNPRDIAAGDTPIARGFIQNGRVTGQILDEAGFVVIEATAACRVR